MQVYDVTEYAKLTDSAYQQEVERLQVELLKLQSWAIANQKRLAIVFEGRDASGKTGVINVMMLLLMTVKGSIKELGFLNLSAFFTVNILML